MTQEIQNAAIDIVRIVGAGIVGGLIATLASHYLTDDRERRRDIRLAKEKFLSDLAALRAELDAAGIGRERFPDLRILTAAICEVERSLTAKQQARLRAVLEECKQYENHSWERNPAADLEWATSDRARQEMLFKGRRKILREFLDRFCECVH